ncbi:MAG: YggS family pyridoxal phosphate-dependent enzyme [Lentisphaeria bacterium]|nr:YggS family pyridoxal phosphate-dependent enzyme [Lentisphaeria bacterium]
MSKLSEQLTNVLNAVNKTAAAAGRKPGEVKLLAVSKTFPASDVLEAYNAGQREFGENRVQELEQKVPVLPNDIVWHLIGHLQSNKAAKAAELADWVHSVDSVKLVNKLSDAAQKAGKTLKILLEVNVSGEESKYGIRTKEDLYQVAEAAVAAPAIEWKGLMTMAPAAAEGEELKQVFAGLRQMRDELEQKYSVTLPELSMGMSGDYPAAIAEGATIVRIGTAIFGGRDYSK